MLGFRRFSLIIIAVVLGACTQPPVGPEPLEFGSDPRILRGTWEGKEVSGKDSSLVLHFKASAPVQDSYQIAGFFYRGGGFPVVNVSGVVTAALAGGAARVTAQLSPGCAVVARSQNGVNDGDWELCGDAPEGSTP